MYSTQRIALLLNLVHWVILYLTLTNYPHIRRARALLAAAVWILIVVQLGMTTVKRYFPDESQGLTFFARLWFFYIAVGLTLLGQVVILYLIDRHYHKVIREREPFLGSEGVESTRQ